MENSRKILKNNQGTYYISIPKEIMKELKWSDNQKVVVEIRGKEVVIKDWVEKK